MTDLLGIMDGAVSKYPNVKLDYLAYGMSPIYPLAILSNQERNSD